MDLTIRRAGPEDAPVLTEIAHAAKAHWGYPAAWIELWRQDLTFTPAFIRAHPVFCAEAAGTIQGIGALRAEGTEWEVEHLWVRPEYMGCGIGGRLLKHIADVAREGGAQALRIVSDPYAEDFYRHHGARRIGTTPSTPPGRLLPVLRLLL